jgi:predicted esterase
MLFIRLAKEPSSPIELAAEGRYERLQRIRIGVIGASKLAGKSVDVLDGDRVLASGTLAADGIASSAALVVPMPPRGHPYGRLTVRAGNEAQLNLNLQDSQSAQGKALDAELVRAKALDADPILFKPFVFTGDKFPACEFQDPVTADECIGPYSLHTKFYDVNFNEVKAPTAPGRYGAVVEVRSEESGKSFNRYCTLFKTPGKVDWSEVKLPDGLSLPQGLGLSDGVIAHQSREIHFQMDHALDERMLRDPDTAVSLTGLFETAPDAPAWLERQDATERDRQWWYRLQQKIGDAVPLKYLAYMPKGYEADPSKKWPLILSLHGAGERGDDLNVLKVYGIPMLCEQGKDDSYIAICPQCPSNQSWLAMQLNDLLDEACKKYRVDPDRIYVTGASMGGVGSWSLVQQYPDRIAAIVPVCGHGDTADIDRIKNLPVWIFHGEADPVVPVAKERAMADALSKVGNQVKMSIYPGVGHECWNQAWATPELIPWMLQQKRGVRSTGVDGK